MFTSTFESEESAPNSAVGSREGRYRTVGDDPPIIHHKFPAIPSQDHGPATFLWASSLVHRVVEIGVHNCSR